MARINFKATPSLLWMSVVVALLLSRASSPLEAGLWWLFHMLAVVGRGLASRAILAPNSLANHRHRAEIATLAFAFLAASTWSVMGIILWMDAQAEPQRTAAVLCVAAPMMGTMLRYRHNALLAFAALSAYLPAYGVFAYSMLNNAGGATAVGILIFAGYAFLMAWQLVRDQETLRQARIRAEDANRAKSAFLAMMSHEIRTPLTGVLGGTEALATRTRDPEDQQLLANIASSGEQLLAILNDVLDFSKIEAGGLQLSERCVNLRTLLQSSVEPYRPRAQSKGLQLSWDVAEGTPDTALLDDTRLRQVLMNLVSNAVKFTESGSVSLHGSLKGAPDAQRLVLIVRDTGPGMDEATIARLFTPFVQADERIARKHGGTGLGLAISRRLVELMDGSLQAHAKPGQGASFEVMVPYHAPAIQPFAGDGHDAAASRIAAPGTASRDASRTASQVEAGMDLVASRFDALASASAGSGAGSDAGQAAVKQAPAMPDQLQEQPAVVARDLITVHPIAPGANPAAASRALPPLRGARVLIAEDNLVNRRIVVQLVESLGAAVVAVENGELALQALCDQPFDAVLMDMQMPERDGLSATRALRAMDGPNRRVPVIAFTANAFAEDRAACHDAGMDDFLAKPVKRTDLLSAIERALSRSAQLAAGAAGTGGMQIQLH